MPVAALRSQTLSQTSIDVENGVLRGVKVAELNHVASFKAGEGENAKNKQITISENHIEALLSHAGNRSLPVHWTHDYLGENRDRLHARVGALKNLRRDESGNLVADLHVAPTEFKERILWNAENDPTGMMMSAVFMYGAHDPDCMPLSFDAADLVAEGAGVTALFSKTQNTDTEMTQEQIEKIVADTTAKTVAALSASASKTETNETAALSAAEQEAGVTQEDHKASDANLPASVASAMRVQRATMRKMEASKKEIVTLAKSEALGAVGSSDFVINTGAAQAKDFNAAVQSEFAAQPEGKKDISRARFQAAQKNVELYNKFRASGAVAA